MAFSGVAASQVCGATSYTSDHGPRARGDLTRFRSVDDASARAGWRRSRSQYQEAAARKRDDIDQEEGCRCDHHCHRDGEPEPRPRRLRTKVVSPPGLAVAVMPIDAAVAIYRTR